MLISKLKSSDIPQSSGIYKFKDKNGKVLYVGKAINLRNRISTYLRRSNTDSKTNLMLDHAVTLTWIETKSDFEALLLEAQLIKTYHPQYNVIWKDDKSYIYMEVTHEEFPTIRLLRAQDLAGGTFYGPFPSKRVISVMLSDVRSIIPFCTQSKKIKRPCFYSHLGLCNPCPGYIRKTSKNDFIRLKKIYRHNIREIKLIFSGRISYVNKNFQTFMRRAAKLGDYERAAFFRDKITLLLLLTQKHYGPVHYIENPNLSRDTNIQALNGLKDILGSYIPLLSYPKSIECYDISNISGKHATGSMVVFIDAKEDKSRYRRFRIRNISRSDDFAMMQQVLKRRLSHCEWPLPNLILIDGGAPQLRAVEKVFKEKGINIPYVGLAKRFEEIVIPINKVYTKLRLPDGASLNLLKRIRDEAHRFAHTYHLHLRLKSLTSNI